MASVWNPGGWVGVVTSALISFIQNLTGAVLRSVQDKLRESVSVLDFGAKGDGVTDDTAAFISAIAAALNSNKCLYIPNPSVEYLISSSLDISYNPLNTKGILIKGTGFNAYYNNCGTLIRYTGTGYLFRILGDPALPAAGAPMSVKISGLSIKGSALAQGAILIQKAWQIRIHGNSFYDFSNPTYGAVLINSVGAGAAFAGEIEVSKNNFHSCWTDIFLTGLGGVINVVRIKDNLGLDQNYGVRHDFTPGSPYSSNIVIDNNHFEGTLINDIYSQGTAQGWEITNNYFEQNIVANDLPRIKLDGTGNRGISISGNTFFKELTTANAALIYINGGDGVNIFSNFSNYGGSIARYCVDLVSCTNSYAETMLPAAGISYALRVNGNVVKTGKVTTEFKTTAAGGAGNFIGVVAGDGFPGGTVETTVNDVNKTNGYISLNFKSTITTKSGVGNVTTIGVLPFVNSGQDITFPVYTTNVTGTKPFYGRLLAGGTSAIVYDANGVVLDYQVAVAVGSVFYATVRYLTQD